MAQCKNVNVFPAMGLAVTAAATLGEASPALNDPNEPLSPSWSDAPDVAIRIAQAVAEQAVAEGVAPERSSGEIAERITQVHWHPNYRVVSG